MATGAFAQQTIVGTTGDSSRSVIQHKRCRPRRGHIRGKPGIRTIGKAQGAAGELDQQHGHRQQPQAAMAAQAS